MFLRIFVARFRQQGGEAAGVSSAGRGQGLSLLGTASLSALQ